MSEKKVRKGVLVIVHNNKNKFLLLKHTKNLMWGFISGGIEEDETDVQAAVRESNEESGLNIDIAKLTKTDKIIKFVSSKGPGEQVVFLYEMAPEPITVDNREICEYQWFTKDEVISNLEAKLPLKNLFLEIFFN